jgi:5'-nucleotidase
MKNLGKSILFLSTLGLAAAGCNSSAQTTSQTTTQALNANPTPTPTTLNEPIKISFFLTNDIHGHLEQMGLIGGFVQQLRAQPEYQSGEAGFLVIDSGDQFQGTLTSNYDEGVSMFKTFNAIGYDAIIPGNHDYDFGPKNWQYDRVTPPYTGNDPREVIEDLSAMGNFPMLSANTFVKASLNMTGTQTAVPVDDSCAPTASSLASPIDFANAVRPSFLKPYLIVQKAGVRIALIGIDNKLTTSVTTGVNVSDLCFRDEVDAYLDVRKSLERQADVFVMLMHNGDLYADEKTKTGSDITQKINARMPGAVDLVAAGHTHVVHNNMVGDVHVMQDGCNGTTYGRVDLFVDPQTKKVLPDLTEAWAGLPVKAATCATNPKALFACKQISFPVQSQASVDDIVAAATQTVAVIGKQKVASVSTNIPQAGRVGESAEGDIMADALRAAGGTQIAFMNAGGLRTGMKKGDLLYEDLFQVTPFGNLGVVMSALPWKNLKSILSRTIKTAGSYGTLEESGLRMTYTASDENTTTQLFESSQLLHVELLDGTVLFDQATGVEVAPDSTYSVTTLDYLATGGDSYDFDGVTVDKTLKIARDLISAVWIANGSVELSPDVDGRFVNEAGATKLAKVSTSRSHSR